MAISGNIISDAIVKYATKRKKKGVPVLMGTHERTFSACAIVHAVVTWLPSYSWGIRCQILCRAM